jgi:hypothetical protein
MCLYSKIFEMIVGFTQLDFYPHIASPFLQKLALKVFVERYSVDFILGNLLVEEQNLGKNTDVAVMDAKRGWRFFLCSSLLCRPLGVPIPPQCPGCGCINCSKWKTSPPNLFIINVTCTNCPYIYNLMPGLDDYVSLRILKGQDGWGIGVYWGPYLDSSPNGTAVFSRGDMEEQIAETLKLQRSKEHYEKLAEKKGAEEAEKA